MMLQLSLTNQLSYYVSYDVSCWDRSDITNVRSGAPDVVINIRLISDHVIVLIHQLRLHHQKVLN